MKEPSRELTDPRDLLVGYLDYFRAAILEKLDGLPDPDVSRVPTGWSPVELLNHLAYVERRWFAWDFAGEPVDHPYGDRRPGGRWVVVKPFGEVRSFYLAQCERSREIVAGAELSDVATTIGRFPRRPPALSWILFHVLQEYARHAGHLDIVRELADGVTGE